MKISSNTGVLVTGGASGLGLAVVEKFVSLGAKVAVFDMNEDEGQKLKVNMELLSRKLMYPIPKQFQKA